MSKNRRYTAEFKREGWRRRRKVDNKDLNVVATWAYTCIRMYFDNPITASDVAEAVGSNVDYAV